MQDCGYETPCWIPDKKPENTGYVTYTHFETPGQHGTRMGAHRLAYMRAKGPIPEGFHIHHHCRVRNCINPDHLEAMLPRDNVRYSPQTKLTPDLVREIRSSAENDAVIARRLGVGRKAIWAVRHRKTWPEISPAIVHPLEQGRNPHWKLTPELVREIRASDENGPKIAARLGVHHSLIYRVRSGKAHANVE